MPFSPRPSASPHAGGRSGSAELSRRALPQSDAKGTHSPAAGNSTRDPRHTAASCAHFLLVLLLLVLAQSRTVPLTFSWDRGAARCRRNPALPLSGKEQFRSSAAPRHTAPTPAPSLAGCWSAPQSGRAKPHLASAPLRRCPPGTGETRGQRDKPPAFPSAACGAPTASDTRPSRYKPDGGTRPREAAWKTPHEGCTKLHPHQFCEPRSGRCPAPGFQLLLLPNSKRAPGAGRAPPAPGLPTCCQGPWGRRHPLTSQESFPAELSSQPSGLFPAAPASSGRPGRSEAQ